MSKEPDETYTERILPTNHVASLAKTIQDRAESGRTGPEAFRRSIDAQPSAEISPEEADRRSHLGLWQEKSCTYAQSFDIKASTQRFVDHLKDQMEPLLTPPEPRTRVLVTTGREYDVLEDSETIRNLSLEALGELIRTVEEDVEDDTTVEVVSGSHAMITLTKLSDTGRIGEKKTKRLDLCPVDIIALEEL